jgi:hypothetical protein
LGCSDTGIELSLDIVSIPKSEKETFC